MTSGMAQTRWTRLVHPGWLPEPPRRKIILPFARNSHSANNGRRAT
jgi:hypothetical protein